MITVGYENVKVVINPVMLNSRVSRTACIPDKPIVKLTPFNSSVYILKISLIANISLVDTRLSIRVRTVC
jgi:hypothetical protein